MALYLIRKKFNMKTEANLVVFQTGFNKLKQAPKSSQNRNM